MASIKELRNRIKSLRNTSKITSAMKMVSAAKLKKSQDAYNRTRPYYVKMEEMVLRVAATMEELDHPLMVVREPNRVRTYVFASDRGLAGSFNNNLLKFFFRSRQSAKGHEYGPVGRRAREFIARNRMEVPADLQQLGTAPTFENAEAIASGLIRNFTDGKVDKVVLFYNKFNSVLSQTPVEVQLLPFTGLESKEVKGKHSAQAGNWERQDNYIFEPNAQELLGELMPKLITVQVLRALLENAVGEHSARMTAMDNATKNTKEIIGNLTLIMNRARQAAITTELTEIVSGAEALKG